ncbi:dihydrofolate reductase [Bosea massiliensis]|uniref:dihydrofolate reductase n=1 Tax=Bosea massiliensis TaxID=151419 RepID=UPI00366BA9C7
MKITLIAAMAQNRVIGASGALPWNLPEDLKHFRRATWGKPMIMGRVTYDSIGRPLPNRQTIVLTRSLVEISGCFVAPSFDNAMETARELAWAMGVDEITVVGGEQIYRLAMPQADRILLTVVQRSVDGDAIFPEIPTDQYELVKSRSAKDGEEELAFLEYQKIA